MERRFVVFIVLSMAVMIGYSLLTEWVLPPPPRPKQPNAKVASNASDEPEKKSADATSSIGAQTSESSNTETNNKSGTNNKDEPSITAENDPAKSATSPSPSANSENTQRVEAIPPSPQQWTTLGSYASTSPYLIHATFNNRGAALECVELTERDSKGRLQFRNLDEPHGYLGYLALTDSEKGCQINCVGRETPAALARCSDGTTAEGLKPGDTIKFIAIKGAEPIPLTRSADLTGLLHRTKPNETVSIGIERRVQDQAQGKKLDFMVTLGVRPLEIISPESAPSSAGAQHPLSCLLSLATTDNLASDESPEQVRIKNELRYGTWSIQTASDSAVEFRKIVQFADPKREGAKSVLEFVKRYRLRSRTEESAATKPPYQIDLDIEIHNRSEHLQRLSYRLEGPNGLPIEGWWYMTKIHPAWFQTAGARDVIWKTMGEGRRLLGTSEIYNHAKKNAKAADRVLFAEGQPMDQRSLAFIGVDTQYFLAAITPQRAPDQDGMVFRHAVARILDNPLNVDKDRIRTCNTTFELISQPFNLEPGQSHVQSFELFTGPKQPAVLEAHGLADSIEYGWFPWVVKPLSAVVHFFYRVVGNWGIAIILLTVLVRGCMFPLSRKAAVNAQMMQQLAPEMKKITEKYKTDMEQRAIAQRALFKQHNYNPFSGCWMVFIQIPIFVGLYRCLAIDIDLRQAALIPGIEWCSNLAGPDKLLPWQSFLPSFLSSETGWLGPFLNVLPIITIILFLLQQKLFTPPATDEQTQMQMTMMKYMTIFMGIMFYKVPGGLCIYFIVSSLWSIGERKLVPKPKVPTLTARANPNEPKQDSMLERLLKMADQMAEQKKANDAPQKKRRK